LGMLALSEGRPHDAFEEMKRALQSSVDIDDRLGQQACMGYLARIAATLGAHDHALALSEHSLAIGKRIHDRFGSSINLQLQLQVLAAMGNQPAAVATMVLLVPLYEATGQHHLARQLEQQLAPLVQTLDDEGREALRREAMGLRAQAIADARARLEQAGLDVLQLPH
ncbi:MAG: hypothetical protein KDK70_28080, partial [Myxococcales bacterium]|nr:hypothetical protein [Myxococcales bacterium]